MRSTYKHLYVFTCGQSLKIKMKAVSLNVHKIFSVKAVYIIKVVNHTAVAETLDVRIC